MLTTTTENQTFGNYTHNFYCEKVCVAFVKVLKEFAIFAQKAQKNTTFFSGFGLFLNGITVPSLHLLFGYIL